MLTVVSKDFSHATFYAVDVESGLIRSNVLRQEKILLFVLKPPLMCGR